MYLYRWVRECVERWVMVMLLLKMRWTGKKKVEMDVVGKSDFLLKGGSGVEIFWGLFQFFR